MTKFTITSFVLLLSFQAFAQLDTVLMQDFEQDFTTIDFPSGNDTDWVALDADGIDPNTAGYETWVRAIEFTQDVDSTTVDTNFVGASQSWLAGFAPGNRNWLITPPITVNDDSYMLHWKSAPLQMPRYMDGYSVIVSTQGNDVFNEVFTDTIFRAAQMVDIVGNSESIDIADFEFSEGRIHGDYPNTWDYIQLFDPETNDSTLLAGLLEPHSFSLAAYEGQTIYIGFLHDSDDDNQISLDDIMVVGNTNSVGAQQLDKAIFQVQTYPNPAINIINLSYKLEKKSDITITVTNQVGQVVASKHFGTLSAGQFVEQLPVHNFPSGQYHINLIVDGQVVANPFIKK